MFFSIRRFLEIRTRVLWVVVLFLALLPLFTPRASDAATNPLITYRVVDVTKANCTTIKQYRRKADDAYAFNQKLVQQTHDQARAYAGEQWKQCLLMSQASIPQTTCDEEWRRVQDAYQKTAQRLGDKAAASEYASAKNAWDVCYKRLKKTTDGQEMVPKEWECYQAYQESLARAKEWRATELDWLAKKHDADGKYLSELQKKCAAPKKNPSPKDPGTPERTSFQLLPKVDVSHVTCPDIRAKQREVERVFRENINMLNSEYADGYKVYEQAMKQCLAQAASDVAKQRCRNAYDVYRAKLMDDFVRKVDIEHEVYNKSIDYLNRLAEQCKKKTGMSYPGGDGEDDPMGEVDVSKAVCATIPDFRRYIKDEFTDRVDAAQKTFEEAKKMAQTDQKNCVRYLSQDACDANYKQTMKQLVTIRANAIEKAHEKQDRDSHELDELQKTCVTAGTISMSGSATSISLGIPTEPPSYSDTNFPDDVHGKLLAYPDTSRLGNASCAALDQLQGRIQATRKYNFNVIDLLHMNAVDDTVKQRDACIAQAATDNAKSACGLQATITMDALRETTDRVMKDDETQQTASLQPLATAETRCSQ